MFFKALLLSGPITDFISDSIVDNKLYSGKAIKKAKNLKHVRNKPSLSSNFHFVSCQFTWAKRKVRSSRNIFSCLLTGEYWILGAFKEQQKEQVLTRCQSGNGHSCKKQTQMCHPDIFNLLMFTFCSPDDKLVQTF